MQSLPEKLTPREIELLPLISNGLTAKMIARELNISYGTVKLHIKNIRQKFDVHTTLEVAVAFTRYQCATEN